MSTEDLYPTDPVEIAQRAADLLERDGWRQGGFGNPGEPQCLLGACMTAAGYPRPEDEAAEDAAEGVAIVTAYAATAGQSPTWWNDRPGRTKEEVIAGLRAVGSTPK